MKLFRVGFARGYKAKPGQPSLSAPSVASSSTKALALFQSAAQRGCVAA